MPAPAAEQTEEVKQTVLRYTQFLAEGYARLSMGGLPEVATEKQTDKLYFHMAALGEGDAKMLANLDALGFDSVTFPGDQQAEAHTHEKWHYVYHAISTGEQRYANEVFYRMIYRLVKKENSWLVDEVRVIENREGEGEGELTFLSRPQDPHAALSPAGHGTDDQPDKKNKVSPLE